MSLLVLTSVIGSFLSDEILIFVEECEIESTKERQKK